MMMMMLGMATVTTTTSIAGAAADHATIAIATATATGTATTSSSTSSSNASSSDRTTTTTTTTTTTCPICYDEFHDNEHLTTLSCQHVYCRDCLYEHCQYWITLHKVPVMCPLHVSSSSSSSMEGDAKHHGTDYSPSSVSLRCSTPLSNAMVHDIVCSCQSNNNNIHVSISSTATATATTRRSGEDQDNNNNNNHNNNNHNTSTIVDYCDDGQNQLWNKYVYALQKQQQRLRTTLRRTCSTCQASFLSSYTDDNHDDDNHDDNHYDDNDDSISNHHLCAMCRLAMILHPSNSMEAVVPTNNNNDNDNNDMMEVQHLLQSMSIKPCSHCSMPLHKTGGCDHVVCPACHQDMCYKCGTHEYLEGGQPQRRFVISCSHCRQDFVDHRQLPSSTCHRWACFVCIYAPFVLYMPILLLYLLVSTAMGLVSLAMSVVKGIIQLGFMLWNLKTTTTMTSTTSTTTTSANTTTTTTSSLTSFLADNSSSGSSSSSYLLGNSSKSPSSSLLSSSYSTIDSKSFPVWKRIWFGLRVVVFFPWSAVLQQQQCCWSAADHGCITTTTKGSTNGWRSWWLGYSSSSKDCRDDDDMSDHSDDSTEQQQPPDDALALLLQVGRRRPVVMAASRDHQYHAVAELDNSYKPCNDLNV